MHALKTGLDADKFAKAFVLQMTLRHDRSH